MAEPKTKPNDISPEDFIESLDDEQRRSDSTRLLKLFTKATKQQPKMWGSSIIGFGFYTLNPGSPKQADWPLVAFSPRKQNLTLYVIPNSGTDNYTELLDRLGKHKTSKACLYINKLEDVDLNVLEQIVKKSYLESKAEYA